MMPSRSACTPRTLMGMADGLAAALTRLVDDPRTPSGDGRGGSKRGRRSALWDRKVQQLEALYDDVLAQPISTEGMARDERWRTRAAGSAAEGRMKAASRYAAAMARERLLVISPVRNEASIWLQSRERWRLKRVPDEWIVVDDGSADGTRDLLYRLAEQFPFMRVLCAPELPLPWSRQAPDQRARCTRLRLWAEPCLGLHARRQVRW